MMLFQIGIEMLINKYDIVVQGQHGLEISIDEDLWSLLNEKHTKDEIKELFKKDIDQALYDEGHGGYSGTIAEHDNVITWASKKVATPERAEELINELQKSKWDPCIGVFYESVEGEGCIVGGWCSS